MDIKKKENLKEKVMDSMGAPLCFFFSVTFPFVDERNCPCYIVTTVARVYHLRTKHKIFQTIWKQETDKNEEKNGKEVQE